jgi:hypothetical protein
MRINLMLTYGFDVDNLEDIRGLIEQALQVHFRRHDSTFFGGDYYRATGHSNECLILFRNWDPIDKEPIQEPGEYKAIMRIEHIDNAAHASELDIKLHNLVKDIKRIS